MFPKLHPCYSTGTGQQLSVVSVDIGGCGVGGDAMETSSSSELDFRCSTQHGRQQQQSQYSVEADEFKLVFLNSDSSSSCHGEEEEEEEEDGEEDDTDSSCSTHHCHSIVSNVEDCDWDYFEPSMISTTTTTTTTMIAYTTARATPTPPPRVRRQSSDSDSPQVQRRPQQPRNIYCPRIRESDTGTDEEFVWAALCVLAQFGPA